MFGWNRVSSFTQRRISRIHMLTKLELVQFVMQGSEVPNTVNPFRIEKQASEIFHIAVLRHI